jgi:hypothetical protein
MLTKEQPNNYEIYARKIGKVPKDIDQWRKEKKETEERQKQSQQTAPKEKAQQKNSVAH